MNSKQKLSPKYWVGHDKTTDDVFTNTMCKGYKDTVVQMEDTFGEDWFLDENFEIILVEVKTA